jgi:GT2 family glycosyltransferase
MIEYINPKGHAIQLSSPDKRIIKVPPNTKIVLSDWYMNYCPKYLRVVRIITENKAPLKPKDVKYAPTPIPKGKITPGQKHKVKVQNQTGTSKPKTPAAQQRVGYKGIKSQTRKIDKRPVVGRTLRDNKKLFISSCQKNKWTVSNNIGVGILSFNRLKSLQRLISSIRSQTDLKKTTVFVSDESTSADVRDWLKKQTDIVVLAGQPRLGVAGNTNRLLRCLSRFQYGILLNDDVEVLQRGWEQFYVTASQKSKYQHFCYHQNGVYGAKRGKPTTTVGGINLLTIKEKPHGAVMFFTNNVFEKVGYFDEKFGMYGIEHVDWSNRISIAGIQPSGFHDVQGSEKYFKIHQDKSVVPQRTKSLQQARETYSKINSNSRIYVNASEESKVPSISVVIPIRNIGRQGAAETVIQSIRSQLFPNIEMIIAEQDQKPVFNMKNVKPCRYFFAKNRYSGQPFTKAMAFNLGVANAVHQKIILQDADIICPSNYVSKIFTLLNSHNGIHIGAKVLYMNQESSNEIITKKSIDDKKNCERAVGYFEGGSLACTKDAYFRCGGFNEIFEGYGIEDCDFFDRLKYSAKFYNSRSEDFVHLWHGRTPGWNRFHTRNKKIYVQLKKRYNQVSYINSLTTKLKTIYPDVMKELSL